MSELSYELNVARGVTGPTTGTCQLASFDRISEHVGISPQTYEQYDALREAYLAACPRDAESNHTPALIVSQIRVVEANYYKELGIHTAKNVLYERAKTEDELSKLLGTLSAGGFRVSVTLRTGGLHAVGLIAAGKDTYRTRSTWTPFEDEERTSIPEIFKYLDQAARYRKRKGTGRNTIKLPNVTAIPAEPSR